MILKYLFGWFMLLVTAVINGAIRDGVYKEYVGDLAAHQISTLTGITLFALVMWWMARRWPISSSTQAWGIGFMWLAMTLCFEFGFFHFVVGHPWSKLLHDYNILEGRVWVAVLVWTFMGPYVFFRIERHNKVRSLSTGASSSP